MITATFSNGFADTYKGSRDVKAAWAIFTLDGKAIASGHSLDAAKAAKTAEGHLQNVWFERDFGLSDHPLRYFKGSYPHSFSKVKREAKAHNAERLAFIRSLVRIEIISL